MAVGAFTFYNLAKKRIGNGTLPLTGNFRMTLHTSASNAATATLATIASVTSEVTSVAASYSSSGKALATRVWTAGASAGQYKFDGDDVYWSAGSTISNLKHLVFWASGASAGARYLLGRIQLSTSQFNLAAGNRLTVQFPSGGIFTLA